MDETRHPAPVIMTRRLMLRPLEVADAEPIQRLFARWEIVRFLSNRVPWPYPADGALTYIRDVALPAMARGEEWHWSLRLRSDLSELVGVISLMASEECGNRGFWLAPERQGRGYMTEAADAVTDFWFNDLGREVLRVPKAIANERSRRISERAGMRVVRTEMRAYVSGVLPAELWEITRAEWLARRGDRKDDEREEA